MTNFQSPVWERVNMFSNRPGLLTLGEGALTFETAQGVHFRCPVAHLKDVAWPWYSFNCALNLEANGSKYRFSFARPNGAGAAWNPVGAASGVLDLGSASKTGKAWKAELARQISDPPGRTT